MPISRLPAILATAREHAAVNRGAGLFRGLAALYLLLGIGDCVTTSFALAAGAHERNPLGASLYAHFGGGALWLTKALVSGMVIAGLAILPRRVAAITAAAFVAVLALVVADNAAQLGLLPPVL